MVSKTPDKSPNRKKYDGRKNLKPCKPWQPGVSGNPKGRPKGARSRATIIREWLETKATDGGPGNMADQITRAQILKASGGDTAAFGAVMDGAFGRVKEVHEFTGLDGQPIETKNVNVEITKENAASAYARIIKDL